MGKGRSATPEPTFKSLHDSGVENFTDNSSEEIEKINRVAKWSAEASRHAEEWSANVTGHTAEWSEGLVGSHEWSEGVTGVNWPEDTCGQVVQGVEWSPGVPSVWTEEYHPTTEYHITVEYHTPDASGYHHAVDQEKIREEFKRKILSNISGGAESELDEEAKIREDFKNQILSNLTVTE